jgi:hypothetical protein
VNEIRRVGRDASKCASPYAVKLRDRSRVVQELEDDDASVSVIFRRVLARRSRSRGHGGDFELRLLVTSTLLVLALSDLLDDEGREHAILLLGEDERTSETSETLV